MSDEMRAAMLAVNTGALHPEREAAPTPRFGYDYDKMASCSHPGRNPHQTAQCSECGKIFWACSATMSDALRQIFVPAALEDLRLRQGRHPRITGKVSR